MTALIRRDINFPPKLTDICDAVNAGEAHADLNFLGRAKGVHVVAKVIRRYSLQQLTRARPHNCQHTFTGSDIHDHNVEITAVTHQPDLIRLTCRSRRHDQIGCLAKARHSHVRLNTSAVIQKLRVDNFANGY